MEDYFLYVNKDNIEPWQCWNYGGIHLNIVGNKILVDTQKNDVWNEDNPVTASDSALTSNLSQDALESKSETFFVETSKYWSDVQWGQPYLMGRRFLFSLGLPPF